MRRGTPVALLAACVVGLGLGAPAASGYTRPVLPISNPVDVAVAPNGSGAFAARSTTGSALTRLGVADFLDYVPHEVNVNNQVAVAYAPNSSLIYGLNEDGYVPVVYGSTNAVGRTITGSAVNAVDIAIDPAGTSAYILSADRSLSSPFNYINGRLKRVELTNSDAVTTVTSSLPQQTNAVAIGPGGTAAYVTHSFDDTLVKVALPGGTLTSLTLPGGSGGSDVVVDPAGDYAYVAGTLGIVAKVRLSDFTVADQSVDIGGDTSQPGTDRIGGIAVAPDGRFVFAAVYSTAGFGSTSLVALDAATLDVVRTLTLASANQTPNAIAVTDEYAFVSLPGSGSGGVMRITLQPDAPTELVATAGDASARIAFRSDEEQLRNVEYSLDGGTWTALSPATTTSPVTIPGLENGRRYSIRLRVVDGLAASAPSDAVDVTPAATPRGSTGTVSETPAGSGSTLRTSTPKVRGNAITTTFTASGPGTATQTGTVVTATRAGRAQAVRACSTTTRVRKAGTITLTCRLTPKARALRRKGALRVRLVTAFTPTGGTKAEGTRVVTLRRA